MADASAAAAASSSGGGARSKSPGRAHCQLNYPRSEAVVEVDVLDKARVCAATDMQQHVRVHAVARLPA